MLELVVGPTLFCMVAQRRLDLALVERNQATGGPMLDQHGIMSPVIQQMTGWSGTGQWLRYIKNFIFHTCMHIYM